MRRAAVRVALFFAALPCGRREDRLARVRPARYHCGQHRQLRGRRV